MTTDERVFSFTIRGTQVHAKFRRTAEGWVNIDPIEFSPSTVGSVKIKEITMYCEDFPCCGHEAGDCDGRKYGSDESIKARVYADIRNGHGECDHQDGLYNCEDVSDDE